MEEKIKKYVNYQFRFDEREDIEELKSEIIANLIDRYRENINSGKNNEEAYVAAIKSMGDFSENNNNDISEEYSVKPTIPDILLMSGAILSVFGLLITFFSAIAGVIFTALSILLFSGSAYYLYSYSQYVRKQYMDIERHNLLLTKIFKYMKTSFVFWAISLSLIMASLVMNLITQMFLIDGDIGINSFGEYLAICFILFFNALLIFLLVFRNIYKRLMHHYYFLTGTMNLKGKIRESYEFLYGKRKTRKSIVLSKKFLPIVGIVLILPHLFIPFSTYGCFTTYDSRLICGVYERILLVGLIEFLPKPYWIIAAVPLILLIVNIIFIFLTFIDKIKKQWILVIGYYAWFGSIILMYFIVGNNFNETLDNDDSNGYSYIMCCLLTIVLIYRNVIQKKRNKKLKENI